jgi:hypothetical protein
MAIMKALTRPRTKHGLGSGPFAVNRFTQFGLLHILATLIVAAAVLIVLNNTVRVLPTYLFLLVLTIGLSLEVGLPWSGLTGLIVVVLWIGAKRLMGVWTPELMLANAAEATLVFVISITGGAYHNRIKALWALLADSQERLSQLDLEEGSLGLLRLPFGQLRVREEEERAVKHRRPLSLLLVSAQPAHNAVQENGQERPILQAMATLVKDVARETDVPFLVSSHLIALLMPETDTADAQDIVNRLANGLQNGRYVHSSGQGIPIRDAAQVRYGFATFLGQATDRPDLLEVARQSLSKNVEANEGPAFQNLLIDWITIGQRPGPASAVSKDLIR